MAKLGISKSHIVRLMVVESASTRRDLCRLSGLSKASITQNINALMDSGIVREGSRFNKTNRGRKTTLISVRPDLAYFIGTDLEGLAVRACIIDSNSEVVVSDKRAISPDWSQEQIEQNWRGLLNSLIKRSGVAVDLIAGIGVGLPGIVSTENFTCQAYLPPGRWLEFDARKALDDFKLPIFAANNVFCVSEFERLKGCASQVQDFISILIRYGAGLSLYIGGQPVLSSDLSAGELGHMQIDMNGPECICGCRGCLDVFISGRNWHPEDFTTSKELEQELAQRAEYLSAGLSNVIKILHVPVIIFNGIYNDYADIVEPVLVERIAERFRNLNFRTPRIVFGEPYELKASMGAGLRAGGAFLESYLDEKVFV